MKWLERLSVRANVIGGMKGWFSDFSGSNIFLATRIYAAHLPRFLEKEPNQVKGSYLPRVQIGSTERHSVGMFAPSLLLFHCKTACMNPVQYWFMITILETCLLCVGKKRVVSTFKTIQIKMCRDCTIIKAKETIEVQLVLFSSPFWRSQFSVHWRSQSMDA